jgi:hypothetical protein
VTFNALISVVAVSLKKTAAFAAFHNWSRSKFWRIFLNPVQNDKERYLETTDIK